MAFKVKKSPLPDPEGPLSADVIIEGANEEVSSILNDNQLNKINASDAYSSFLLNDGTYS